MEIEFGFPKYQNACKNSASKCIRRKLVFLFFCPLKFSHDDAALQAYSYI